MIERRFRKVEKVKWIKWFTRFFIKRYWAIEIRIKFWIKKEKFWERNEKIISVSSLIKIQKWTSNHLILLINFRLF